MDACRHGKEEYTLMFRQQDMDDIFNDTAGDEGTLGALSMNNSLVCKELIARMRIEKVGEIGGGWTLYWLGSQLVRRRGARQSRPSICNPL